VFHQSLLLSLWQTIGEADCDTGKKITASEMGMRSCDSDEGPASMFSSAADAYLR
jgi:hypothetical protein